MNRLGFTRYYVQGGDWGAIIGTAMATLFPQRFIYIYNFVLLNKNDLDFLTFFTFYW